MRERERDDQAVLIHLDGVSLSDEIYKTYDLAELEAQLAAAISKAGVGEYDGSEYSFDEVVLYAYGHDAAAIYKAIEPVVFAYPLCRNAKIHIRPGGSEIRGREVHVPRE